MALDTFGDFIRTAALIGVTGFVFAAALCAAYIYFIRYKGEGCIYTCTDYNDMVCNKMVWLMWSLYCVYLQDTLRVAHYGVDEYPHCGSWFDHWSLFDD